MKSSEIAYFLGKTLVGEDIEIQTFSSLSNPKEDSLVFAKSYSKANTEIINNAKNVLAIVCKDYQDSLTVSHIISDNPRLDYLKIVGHFFSENEIPVGVHPTAVIEEGAIIGNNVSIGAHCYIGSKVTIGDNTVVLPNTSLYGKVTIGANCYIKPGVVIGGPGFGFEYDEDGIPIHFPHTGEVIIGNNVFIGGGTIIDRGTIDATIIEDNTKIDNLVSVGHNSHIGENSLIIGGSLIGGGVKIGKNVWVSTGSTIIQKVSIGDYSKVGLGSVVLRNVKESSFVFGNPAKKVIAPQNKK